MSNSVSALEKAGSESLKALTTSLGEIRSSLLKLEGDFHKQLAALDVTLAGVVGATLADAFDERAWEFLPALFLGFLVILAEAAASHSASENAWWPLGPVADAIHLYGAALWAGGLLAPLRTRRWLREPTPPAFSEGLLHPFSRPAPPGVLLVASAGPAPAPPPGRSGGGPPGLGGGRAGPP